MSLVLRLVLAFTMTMCPISVCLASASARVQETALPEQLACNDSQTPCRLTSGDKFRLFVKRGYTPGTYASAGLSAGLSQVRKDKYGTGIKGYRQRYGANLADGETHSFFQTYLYSRMFHQDPRYHRLGEGTFAHRSLYVASRLVVGRTDRGRDAINAPELLGTLTTSAIGNLYYPEEDRGLGWTVIRATSMLGSRVGIFALKEFLPDLRRKLRRPKSGNASAL